MFEYQKIKPLLLITIAVTVVLLIVLFAAQLIKHSSPAQAVVAQFGYIGVVLVAVIAGLNFIVPIPAFTLTPIFTASGLLLPGIVLSLTLGTLIADYIGYSFGNWSRTHIYKNYPRVVAYLEKLHTDRPHLIMPATFLFAAVVPLPNEVLVIPLALLQVRWRVLVLPLFLGNLLNQTIYAVGFQTVFNWLF